ncbi:glycosyltransferase family 39 protein [Candidatus Parcubacteria bacterium]|nr:glycosyltransferase family 39 protein [Candidatus Parcubacteria bacterium]
MRTHSKSEILVFFSIVAIAILFRFYHLHQTPPGLYPDEAMNGSNAIVANMNGDYKIFYPENNGREGLFINLQAISIKLFGNTAFALRLVSAIIGVLTVIGLYLLTKELFEWHIAALSSFLLAISFWHVNFSRIGFRAIMLPLILVYLFHFLWRGLKQNRLEYFFWAGVIAGLGFYTYTSYRIAPFILILVLINYFLFLKRDFSYTHYEYTRHRLFAGTALLLLTAFFIALPIGIYFLNHSDQFFSRAGSGLFVFTQQNPLQSLGESVIKTLAMFNFAGDYNPRHNLSGMPMIPWPIGVFFVIGFFKELVHWIQRKHGHLSTTHTLLFSWFFIMLLPGFLSIEAPHALRTIGVVPVVMIFAGRGLWWVFSVLGGWYKQAAVQHNKIAAVTTLCFVCLALGVYEFNRYFNVWAKEPITNVAFDQSYTDLANKLNKLPRSTPKYVIVAAPGVLVDGIPMPAQAVMFLTDTPSKELQKSKNIYYLTVQQARTFLFPPGSVRYTLQ